MAIFMLGIAVRSVRRLQISGIIADRWGWRAAFFVACVPGLLLAI